MVSPKSNVSQILYSTASLKSPYWQFHLYSHQWMCQELLSHFH